MVKPLRSSKDQIILIQATALETITKNLVIISLPHFSNSCRFIFIGENYYLLWKVQLHTAFQKQCCQCISVSDSCCSCNSTIAKQSFMRQIQNGPKTLMIQQSTRGIREIKTIGNCSKNNFVRSQFETIQARLFFVHF